MGKVLPKKKFFKSSIFSPKLKGNSHIDNVRNSLDNLIFSNERESERNLFKKRVKVVIFVTIFLMIFASFFSPKGKAEVATFYPTACLGGWNNPKNAEGEPQTSSNDDYNQFTKDNSAVLTKNTRADLYCGNFSGTFDNATKPTKILVAVSLASGVDPVIESSSTSSQEIATSTDATSTQELNEATSTDTTSTTTISTSTDILESGSSTENSFENKNSVIENIIDTVKDVVNNLFDNNQTPPTPTPEPVPTPEQTPTTTPTPEPVPTPVNTDSPPTSFLNKLIYSFFDNSILKAFAEDDVTNDISSTTEIISPDIESQTESSSTKDINITDISTTTSPTTEEVFTATTSTSTPEIVATTTELSTETSADFLEVFYTFDGENWQSLGSFNEVSMKYRTFEIPVTASTSWEDMSKLQIKITPKSRFDETPAVYVDAIKVEVLYETSITHEHPDFKRDTILQDEIVDGIRIIRIINNDTNEEEVWYMYVEETYATSTVNTSSSTNISNSTTSENVINESSTSTSIGTSSQAITGTSTVVLVSTSSEIIKPIVVKNKWLKFDGDISGEKGISLLVKEIKEQEEKKEYILPDFTKDLIRKIGGNFLNEIIVQIEQSGVDSLWLFNVESNTEEKLDIQGKTTVSKSYPFGIKGGNVFWLSEDEKILFAYNIDSKKIEQKEIPAYDKSVGERGEVTFEDISWKVIIGADSFSFYSPETGEVFSDDNLTTSEAFRIKEKLDALLTKEKLEELNFVIDENTQ